MENILTDKQKLDILNTFEKIYDNIKSIVTVFDKIKVVQKIR